MSCSLVGSENVFQLTGERHLWLFSDGMMVRDRDAIRVRYEGLPVFGGGDLPMRLIGDGAHRLEVSKHVHRRLYFMGWYGYFQRSY